MPTVLEAFRDAVLDRFPIYGGTGREVMALAVPDAEPEPAALVLADACRRWLAEALEAAAEAESDLRSIASNAAGLPAVASPIDAARVAGVARDAGALVRAFPPQGDAGDVARSAAEATRAAAGEAWGEVPGPAAEALRAHGFTREGITPYVAGEVAAIFAAACVRRPRP
jgi:hypothetical protein